MYSAFIISTRWLSLGALRGGFSLSGVLFLFINVNPRLRNHYLFYKDAQDVVAIPYPWISNFILDYKKEINDLTGVGGAYLAKKGDYNTRSVRKNGEVGV